MIQPRRNNKNIFCHDLLIPAALFLLALLARAPSLGLFFTADEPLWVERSHEFTAGLLFADHHCSPVDYGRQIAATGWGCTYQIGYPGVTTMWGGMVGLLLYYGQEIWDPSLKTFLETLIIDPVNPDLIAAMRLPFAVAGALFPAVFYMLLRRLISSETALVAALLVALNPFHIALSRVIHHDALTTTFMALSLLTMTGYWLQGWRWYWLLISAGLAGLAFLTKSVGWFMMPCATLISALGLYYRCRRGQACGWPGIRRWLGEGALWGVTAWLTFAALFPAVWVIPRAVIAGLISANFELGLEGHKNGHYFWGQVSLDPGWLYYPVGWLLRASPLELLGLLSLPLMSWRLLRSSPFTFFRKQLDKNPVLTALALFVLFFLLFETLSGKKMLRYFLPAFPIIQVFVATGLLWLTDRLLLLKPGRPLSPLVLSIGLILIVQGWLVFSHYPYYFTYYNPLLGGTPPAARLITIDGWGEGLNEAAAYLNQQPAPESLLVRSWYPDTLTPFFPGRVSDFSVRAGNNLSAHYLVYYQNQLQRNLQKNMDVWRYLNRRYIPVHRITLHNLDYAVIYRNPIEHFVDWTKNGLPDIITIFGYNLTPEGNMTLFWQNLGTSPGQKLWIEITPSTGGELKRLDCSPLPAFASELHPAPGAIIETSCPLDRLQLPAGLYDIRLGLVAGNEMLSVDFPAGRLLFSVDESGVFTTVQPQTGLDYLLKQKLPDDALPLNVQFGGLARLVGYQVESPDWEPGQIEELTLYWQPLQNADSGLVGAFELVLKLSLKDTAEPVAMAVVPLFPKTLPDQTLTRGQVLPAHYPISVPDTLSAGQYQLHICLRIAADGQLLTGTISGTGETVKCLLLAQKIDIL